MRGRFKKKNGIGGRGGKPLRKQGEKGNIEHGKTTRNYSDANGGYECSTGQVQGEEEVLIEGKGEPRNLDADLDKVWGRGEGRAEEEKRVRRSAEGYTEDKGEVCLTHFLEGEGFERHAEIAKLRGILLKKQGKSIA